MVGTARLTHGQWGKEDIQQTAQRVTITRSYTTPLHTAAATLTQSERPAGTHAARPHTTQRLPTHSYQLYSRRCQQLPPSPHDRATHNTPPLSATNCQHNLYRTLTNTTNNTIHRTGRSIALLQYKYGAAELTTFELLSRCLTTSHRHCHSPCDCC